MKPVAGALVLALAILAGGPSTAAAHDGPPYPIVNERRAGPYVISVWTDPDTTDDGTAGGQFWVMFSDDERTEPERMQVSITATPVGGGPSHTVEARPAGEGDPHFGALVLDREGRFRINVEALGPRGAVSVDAEVDATYDLRPSGFVAVLYALPFALLGLLWAKVLLQRRSMRTAQAAGTGAHTTRGAAVGGRGR